ncbi:alpha-ribazole phosphatase [Haloimpatiens lingqiaonensis]|uniref:alpha-ribazole phosphatase n=1 Tax=Haloimpatiens lingqiaonensis TaxID=1380675 RepID=UPI0010FE6B93|nr:alpha-ribazole phosphatase [Haloimpatiens lingqiaonensis]
MNIYLVRHGETGENAKGTYYGSMDVGLNARGIAQIETLANFFKKVNIDKVYISDTKRAHETAKIILRENPMEIIKDDRLKETNFGDFEGKTFEEISKRYPKECQVWSKDWKNFRPPNGETYVEMYKRVSDFMDELKKMNCDNVLIVTHSGVIKGILCYVMDGNIDLFWKFACSNGDRVLIKYEYGNLYLDSITHALLVD